jgi:hypothetical protein
MEHAYNATNSAANQTLAPRVPELGRLKAASERIAMATNRIESFNGRFHGPQPVNPTIGMSASPSDGYRNDLDCLFAQLDRLNDAVNALDIIG